MSTYRQPQDKCPLCRTKLDSHTVIEDVDSHEPGPGDCTVCIGCGELLEFDESLRLILITDKSEQALKDQGSWSTILKAQELIRANISGQNVSSRYPHQKE